MQVLLFGNSLLPFSCLTLARVWVEPRVCSQAPAEGHLGCSQFLAFTNNTPDICIQVFVGIQSSFS